MLPQPLAPVGGKFDATENQSLGQALIEYQQSQASGAPPDLAMVSASALTSRDSSALTPRTLAITRTGTCCA